MIKHILLGNTITINVKGDFSDVNNVRVYIIDPRFNRKPLNYTIDNGGLVILYQGKDQKYYGMYSIEVIKNQGQDTQETIKKEYLFCLVGCSEDATDPNEIDVDTTFQVGVLGSSINGMKSDLENIKKQLEEFDLNVITNLEKKHDTDISELTKKHSDDINEINSEVQSLTEKITGVENEHDNDINDINNKVQSLTEKITGVENEHESDINEINAGIQSLSDKITEMENGYDSKLGEKVEKLDELVHFFYDKVDKKQDQLYSGENIKTINGETLLGEGDIEIKSNIDLPIGEGDGTNSVRVNKLEVNSARGENAFCVNLYTSADGRNSFAHGEGSTALGQASVVGGFTCNAINEFSHAEGCFTTALNKSEFSIGMNNISTQVNNDFGYPENTLFSVGNGKQTYDANQHNAFEIKQDGTIYIVDVNSEGDYYEKSMINLQDKLSELEKGGGGSSLPENFVEDMSNMLYMFQTEHQNLYYEIFHSSFNLGNTGTNRIEPKWTGEEDTNKAEFNFQSGEGLLTGNKCETAFGRYNLSYNTSSALNNGLNTLFSIGCGTSNENRFNGLMVMQDGNVYINKCDSTHGNYQLSEICKKVDWGVLKSLFITSSGTIPYNEYIPKGSLAVGEYCMPNGEGSASIGYGVVNNSQYSLAVGQDFQSDTDSILEVGNNHTSYFKVDVNGNLWVYSSGMNELVNITEKFREMGWIW